MIVSISQPAYLPWLGYFDRIYRSDVHIILNDVTLDRSSKTRFTNRNKIKTKQGPLWLTVPVIKAGQGQPYIYEIKLEKDSRWAKKHLGILFHNYSQTKYFLDHKNWFEWFYMENWNRLETLLDNSTNYLMEVLGIDIPMIKSSKMMAKGKKSDYILNLCIEAGATQYLSGPFGRDYLDLKKFEEKGIKIEFHDYSHPKYQQIHGEFVPYMSIVDLILNEGPKSLEILIGRSNK